MIRLPSAVKPEVSLLLVLDGAAEMAERCLRAVADGASVPCETVILLNDPDPLLEDLVRKGTTGAQVIVARANAGTGVGWNLGAEVARAPRLATLHEDSEPDAGWLEPLCETMTETGAGAVGSRLYNHDGTVQNCGWVLFSDATVQQINPLSAPDVVAMSEPSPADLLSSAATLLDREVVRAAGGWDERFQPAVYFDIDISTAAWSQGRAVLSVPASTVRHQSGTLTRRENTPLTGPRLGPFLVERHSASFLAKWDGAMRGHAPPPPDREPESIRAAVHAALAHTRERAERVRAGKRKPSRSAQPRAERPYSGVPKPLLDQGEGTYTVAAEVEEALRDAERQTLNDYCSWLVRQEQEVFDQLADTREWLRHREQETADLHARTAKLQLQNQEFTQQLDHVLNSRTWRLRTLARSILRSARAIVRRALAAIGRS